MSTPKKKTPAKRSACKVRIPKTVAWLPKPGDAICIRTVTHYHVGVYDGEVMLKRSPFLALSQAAWVADTGRFAQFLATGVGNEIEPFGGPCLVGPGAIIDICPWRHPLLEVVK
jgi:hypothetical protein